MKASKPFSVELGDISKLRNDLKGGSGSQICCDVLHEGVGVVENMLRDTLIILNYEIKRRVRQCNIKMHFCTLIWFKKS